MHTAMLPRVPTLNKFRGVSEILEAEKQLGFCAVVGLEESLIQEALFYSTGTEHDLTQLQFEKRLKRFLRRRGFAGFVRLFLSLHLFNVVWFETTIC